MAPQAQGGTWSAEGEHNRERLTIRGYLATTNSPYVLILGVS